MLCIAEKPVQRGAGASSHDVEYLARGSFHTAVFDTHAEVQPVADGPEESAFLGDRFEQGDLHPAAQQLGQDEPRKAGAAAQIGQRGSVVSDVGTKLGAIPDMAPPDVGQRPDRHKIVAGVPVSKHCHEGFQPRQCFT